MKAVVILFENGFTSETVENEALTHLGVFIANATNTSIEKIQVHYMDDKEVNKSILNSSTPSKKIKSSMIIDKRVKEVEDLCITILDKIPISCTEPEFKKNVVVVLLNKSYIYDHPAINTLYKLTKASAEYSEISKVLNNHGLMFLTSIIKELKKSNLLQLWQKQIKTQKKRSLRKDPNIKKWSLIIVKSHGNNK